MIVPGGGLSLDARAMGRHPLQLLNGVVGDHLASRTGRP